MMSSCFHQLFTACSSCPRSDLTCVLTSEVSGPVIGREDSCAMKQEAMSMVPRRSSGGCACFAVFAAMTFCCAGQTVRWKFERQVVDQQGLPVTNATVEVS